MSLSLLQKSSSKNGAKTAPKQLGRRKFLVEPMTTTLSIDGPTLKAAQGDAFKRRMSLSQWMADAARAELKRMKRRKALK